MSSRAVVALASACSLPTPVAEQANDNCINSCAIGNKEKVLRAQHLHAMDNSNVQVAPYQALPVSGPVITHNISKALNILEPSGHLSEEVSASC
jgi:histidine decarboxylase